MQMPEELRKLSPRGAACKKGIGDTKAEVKEFAEELKPILDKLGLKIAVALDCYEDRDMELMSRKIEEAHELYLKLNELVKERR